MKKAKQKRFSLRQRRIFSTSLKRKIVAEIESGQLSVLSASREYGTSDRSVYNWLNKYSLHLKTSTQIVVQMESEEKKNSELKNRIAELERIVGQKQLTIDVLEKMLELGKRELGVDLKKKYFTPLLTGSEQIKAAIAIK